jgi:superfamily I DNA/RNA helicase/RecB family exonuclease
VPVITGMSVWQGIFEHMRVTTVFASPGAGKTTQIIQRFSRAVTDGLSPSEILVLAASREAANQLRDDLALSLQRATPGSLARTLTSFAYGVLRVKAVQAGAALPELISGSEQDRILAEIIGVAIEETELDWPKHINAQVMALNGFRAELRDLITACLEHGVTPVSLRELGQQHGKAEWVASAKLFEHYMAVASSAEFESKFDPTLLLRDAADWLSVLAEWPAAVQEIKLILVDDAQELTPAASYLLRVLTSRGADLVLIGDPDASTLGFRAADPRAMSNLAQAIAADHSVVVEEIFLQAAHAIRTPAISKVLAKVSAQIDTARAGRQRKGLNPAAELVAADTAGLEGHVFNQPQAETAWLARRLRELHLYDGVAWNEIAVVARSRGQLDQLAVELSHEQVPVEVAGAQSALRDEFGSRTLLRLADVVLHDRQIDIGMAIELLSSPLCGLDSLGLRRLRRGLRREELLADGTRNSDELLVELFDASGSVVTITSQEGKRVDRFLKNYFAAKAIADDYKQSIEDLLWQVWNASGLAKNWQELSRGIGEVALQANRNLDSVVALFAAANRFAERNPNGDPRIFVDQQLALGLPEDSLALNDKKSASVLLLTPSGLIGRRFKVVALPQLVEGVWPNLRPRSSLLGASTLDGLMSGRIEDPNQVQRSELPDELRMLHKAVGATSERLLISATETDDNQISQFVNLMLGEIPVPTNFSSSQLTLRGMAANLRRKLALLPGGSSSEVAAIDSAALGLARLADAGVAGAHPDSWYGLLPLSTIEPLADLANEDVVIRPSQLENFVKCPLHWFLNAHGGGDKTFSANLGSLVHKALELGAEVSEESLWKLVESKWHTLSFESDWLEQAGERKAKKMIGNMVQYLRKFEAEGAKVIGREVSFEFQMGKAQIRGQVDRLELYPDGRVMIVDLKTGSKVFSAEEAREHAQLGLYQLAFEHGAFNEQLELPAGFNLADAKLGGAKLLLVSGEKPTEREQASVSDSATSKKQFEQMVAAATQGMSMTDNIFIAQVGEHCTNDNEYGSCKIHLTKAVSFVG